MRAAEFINQSRLLGEVSRPGWYSAIDTLTKAGYQKLGDGSYASVFGRPDKNYVLKLFDAEDKAYVAFYNLVKNQNNKHFPKFKGQMMRIAAEYYAVRMERLQPMPKRLYGYSSYIIAYTIEDYVEGDTASAEQIDIIKVLREKQPDFLPACEYVKENLKGQYYLDFHTNNMMMRNETIVITDPVFPN